MKFILSALFLLSLFACHEPLNSEANVIADSIGLAGEFKSKDHSWLVPFSRDSIEQNLLQKIEQGDTLLVHALIPLCDNEHQGIVPTTKSLGDGFNLKSNLYWATSHGLKRYFVEHSQWAVLENKFDPTDTILERVSFYRQFENGAKVVLICDAYRGDRMYECLTDYFSFLAGKKSDSLKIKNTNLACGKDSDLLVFNGHNGIYEAQPDSCFATSSRQKDAVVIACGSYWNYLPFIRNSNCYPLVTTTQSMYPGATVLNKIIESWANLEGAEAYSFCCCRGLR
jgi:hypothetical protein